MLIFIDAKNRLRYQPMTQKGPKKLIKSIESDPVDPPASKYT